MRARARRLRATPPGVRLENVVVEGRAGEPYRGLAARQILRLSVAGGPQIGQRDDLVLEIDDLSVVVRTEGASEPAFVVTGVDALFIVDRQPPSWRFFTWYGVYARRHGRGDQLIFETPDQTVARFVERAIEQRLDLDDDPVHGELRELRAFD